MAEASLHQQANSNISKQIGKTDPVFEKQEVVQYFANISWLKEFPSIKDIAGCIVTGFIFIPHISNPATIVERV